MPPNQQTISERPVLDFPFLPQNSTLINELQFFYLKKKKIEYFVNGLVFELDLTGQSPSLSVLNLEKNTKT
jgi:hypothetical protein